MTTPVSGNRVAAVSLGLVPLVFVAALASSAGTSALAALSLEGAGQEVSRAAILAWAHQHLLITAVFNASVLIPGSLWLARSGGRLSWDALGIGRPRAARNYFLGGALGMVVLLAPAWLGYLTGGLQTAMDTEIGVRGFDALGGIVLVLPALVVASFAEELVLRGFLLRLWVPRFGKWSAVLGTSALFALLHAGNPDASLLGSLGAFIAGIWLGLAFLESGCLLFVAGLHLGWNAAIAVVLGLPVSGLALPALLRWVPSDDASMHLLWGGAYGPEEGLAFHLALLVGTFVCLRIGRKLNPQRVTPRA